MTSAALAAFHTRASFRPSGSGWVSPHWMAPPRFWRMPQAIHRDEREHEDAAVQGDDDQARSGGGVAGLRLPGGTGCPDYDAHEPQHLKFSGSRGADLSPDLGRPDQ